MTGLESSVSAILRTSASVSSDASPDTSTSKRLPWRTSTTPSNPSRGSAPSTALPCGSRISGLGITSTTYRATSESLGVVSRRSGVALTTMISATPRPATTGPMTAHSSSPDMALPSRYPSPWNVQIRADHDDRRDRATKPAALDIRPSPPARRTPGGGRPRPRRGPAGRRPRRPARRVRDRSPGPRPSAGSRSPTLTKRSVSTASTPRQVPTSASVRNGVTSVSCICGFTPTLVTSRQCMPACGSPSSTSSTARRLDCHSGRLRGSAR